MKSSHRNSQQRIYLDGACYFITFKTYERYPYFQEPIFCDIFMENLKLCKKIKQFELYAFNLLYEHAHLLLKPVGRYNYSQIIQGLKKNITQDINKVMDIYPESANSNSRFHKVDITEYRNKFIRKYGKNQCAFPMFRWHKSFYDHIIRDEQDFQSHYRYTVYNHQKHGLPENWKYTGLNYSELINLGYFKQLT